MARLTCDISVSLDGFIAGPNPSLEEPLGEGGDRLHEWAYGQASWRERHGLEGGERGADSEVMEEAFANTGAAVMGRRMFSGGEGGWEDDPRSNGWWGEEPPFDFPVFVLTHHAREPLTLGQTTFTFVTGGTGEALEEARAAAGDRDVSISGGASAIQQYLRAGQVDEIQIHVAPVLLGGGTRLFDGLGENAPGLEILRVVESPAVTHISYRVVNSDSRKES